MSLGTTTAISTSATNLSELMGITKEELLNFPHLSALRWYIKNYNLAKYTPQQTASKIIQLIEGCNHAEKCIYAEALESLSDRIENSFC